MHFISANERGPRNRFALKRSKVPAGRTIYFRLSKLEQRSVLHPVFIIQRSRGAHSAMHRADSRQIRYLDIESLSRAQRETPKLIYRISMSLRAERRVASRCARILFRDSSAIQGLVRISLHVTFLPQSYTGS